MVCGNVEVVRRQQRGHFRGQKVKGVKEVKWKGWAARGKKKVCGKRDTLREEKVKWKGVKWDVVSKWKKRLAVARAQRRSGGEVVDEQRLWEAADPCHQIFIWTPGSLSFQPAIRPGRSIAHSCLAPLPRPRRCLPDGTGFKGITEGVSSVPSDQLGTFTCWAGKRSELLDGI